jgi:dsDNA-specific endonuclease/ATPase MutS2
MLGSAIAYKFNKVIFIHGIGNGSLKQAILQRLQEYEDIEFRTASFAKYGNGAVELVIHRNQ